MKKENMILAISIIALCFSLLSFLLWFCKYEPVTWSLLDVCFSVISVGITAFVASQIYHSFTLTRNIEEKNALLKKDFEEESKKQIWELKDWFENIMRSYDHNVNAVVYQLGAINEHFSVGNYEKALHLLMKALNEANISRKNEIKGVKNPAEGIISYIKQFKIRGIKLSLPAEKVEVYKLILADTQDKDAIDLIPYIQSLSA